MLFGTGSKRPRPRVTLHGWVVVGGQSGNGFEVSAQGPFAPSLEKIAVRALVVGGVITKPMKLTVFHQ